MFRGGEVTGPQQGRHVLRVLRGRDKVDCQRRQYFMHISACDVSPYIPPACTTNAPHSMRPVRRYADSGERSTSGSEATSSLVAPLSRFALSSRVPAAFLCVRPSPSLGCDRYGALNRLARLHPSPTWHLTSLGHQDAVPLPVYLQTPIHRVLSAVPSSAT